MWLINRLKPDFKTIADFRKNNKPAFVATCRAFVRFCRTAGLIAGELVAIDGSKFQAVAPRGVSACQRKALWVRPATAGCLARVEGVTQVEQGPARRVALAVLPGDAGAQDQVVR